MKRIRNALLAATAAVLLCIGMLVFYVWVISDSVDVAVDELIERDLREDEERWGR